MTCIGILEDNLQINKGIETYLKKHGYKVKPYFTIEDFRREKPEADLYILDINLPDGSGFDLVKSIKTQNKPIIFLTVKDQEYDIIKGLNIGGDDYITKPFKLSILLARIRSVLRRYDNQNKEVLCFGALKMDLEGTQVSLNGDMIDLTAREYKLLKTFLENAGKTLTRAQLLELWDREGEFIEDNSLSVAIRRLRKKLGTYGEYIETVRGLGYRFEYKN